MNTCIKLLVLEIVVLFTTRYMLLECSSVKPLTGGLCHVREIMIVILDRITDWGSEYHLVSRQKLNSLHLPQSKVTSVQRLSSHWPVFAFWERLNNSIIVRYWILFFQHHGSLNSTMEVGGRADFIFSLRCWNNLLLVDFNNVLEGCATWLTFHLFSNRKIL